MVGIGCNIVAMVIGSSLTQVTKEEKEEREKLFILPESEKNQDEVKKTLKWTKRSCGVGVVVFGVMMVFWIIPYLRGLN